MLKPHLADDGYVVSVQNGLNENLIAEMIGEDRTIGAFINFSADYYGPGDILFGARSTVVVGELGGEITPRLQTLHKELQAFEPNAIATNNVAAVLAFPIALTAARHMHVDVMPFAITIMVAASASFATPIGYQTNLMVYNAGGYRFADFVRIGLPLTLLVGLVTVWLVPLIWAF